MKKLLLTLLGLIFLAITPPKTFAQTCKDLQEKWAEIDKKLERLALMKEDHQDFFSLIDDPESGLTNISEEMANCEHRIELFSSKITAGDNSPETAEALRVNQLRLELYKLRTRKDFNKTTISKDPRLVELRKSMNNNTGTQGELKIELANLESEMKTRNCPINRQRVNQIDDDPLDPKTNTNNNKEKTKNNGNDKPTISKPLNPEGNWIYTDPKHAELVMGLRLNGSGSSVTGTMKFGPPEMPAKYDVSGCVDVGENRLRCSFTGVLEDEDKFVDTKGKVDLSLTGGLLETSWQESGPPAVRWKPGHESTIKRIRDANTMPITFTKQ